MVAPECHIFAKQLLSRFKTEDWEQIADAVTIRLPSFGHIIGLPEGGEALAATLLKRVDRNSPITLMVDDCYAGPQRFNMWGIDSRKYGVTHFGVVAIACVNTPLWVRCFAKIMV